MAEKTILVLAASRYQLPAVMTARKLGYRVITADNRPDNPGHAVADKSYMIDTTDCRAILAMARSEDIDGIIAPATDVAVPTAAYVAEKLGLPGNPYESTLILCNKAKFRAFQTANAMPAPAVFDADAVNGPAPEIFDAHPCIMKPDRSSGSKGTFIIRSYDEYLKHLPESRRYSPAGKVVVEAFIEGFQGTLEGVLADGEPVWTCFLDRQTARAPYVTTCGHHLPTRLPVNRQRRVLEQVRLVCRRLGIADGPFDCDFVVTDDEAYLLEVTPRIGGNAIADLLLRASGFDITAYGVKIACHDPAVPPSCDVPFKPVAVVLLGVFAAGRLYYDAVAAARLNAEAWVDELRFDVDLNVPVEPFENGRRRVGQCFIHGATRDELDRRVAEFRRRLDLRAVS